jgi:hypothetical protein
LFALIVDAQRPHKQGLPVGSEHEERLFFETLSKHFVFVKRPSAGLLAVG